MPSYLAMNPREYKEQVGRIPYGKRLPTALCVHRQGLADLGGTLGTVIDQVVARYQVSAQFNLVKFRTAELKLSFLAYPDFETDPHPALRPAITIDLATGKARPTDYARNLKVGFHRINRSDEDDTLAHKDRRWTTQLFVLKGHGSRSRREQFLSDPTPVR